MSTLAPSPAIAESAAPVLKTWRVPCTLDGYVEIRATSQWAAQRAFEQLSRGQIAEHLDLWAGEPELKESSRG